MYKERQIAGENEIKKETKGEKQLYNIPKQNNVHWKSVKIYSKMLRYFILLLDRIAGDNFPSGIFEWLLLCKMWVVTTNLFNTILLLLTLHLVPFIFSYHPTFTTLKIRQKNVINVLNTELKVFFISNYF